MIRKLSMAAAAVALLIPAISNAQAAPPPAAGGFTLGLRIGYAPAMGDEMQGVPLSDTYSAQIPIQVDALYRFTPDFAAGAYLSYGFGRLNSDFSNYCSASGVDCSASTTRFGVEGIYSINNVSPQFVPWLGLGIGYEWYTFKASIPGASISGTESGFEFLNLQLGGDFKVSPQFAVGPYVMLSIGQFSDIEGQSIPDKGTHEWFNVGFRGKFDL